MDLTPAEHETSEAVSLAADWYRENRHTCPRPVVRHLRTIFPISTKEACEAIAEANRLDRVGDTLAHQTAVVAKRYRMPPTRAGVIAELAFAGGRR